MDFSIRKVFLRIVFEHFPNSRGGIFLPRCQLDRTTVKRPPQSSRCLIFSRKKKANTANPDVNKIPVEHLQMVKWHSMHASIKFATQLNLPCGFAPNRTKPSMLIQVKYYESITSISNSINKINSIYCTDLLLVLNFITKFDLYQSQKENICFPRCA